MITTLLHRGDCVGTWRIGKYQDCEIIECTHCTATYTATPDNRLDAIESNQIGNYLRTLTIEGMKYLDNNRKFQSRILDK